MSLATQFRDLARYNRWMNDRLYAVAATLADADRRRDAGAFFGSIHRTLNHLLLTDRAWLGRITRNAAIAESRDAAGQPIAMSGRLDQELYAEFEPLRRERVRTDADLIAWADTLDDARLAAPIRYRTSKGEPCEHPLWWAVTHLFNHHTHHRGQLTTLLTQLGHDPGVTDLIAFLRAPRA
jgi:uncharacterized damage-inducible protein DinB